MTACASSSFYLLFLGEGSKLTVCASVGVVYSIIEKIIASHLSQLRVSRPMMYLSNLPTLSEHVIDIDELVYSEAWYNIPIVIYFCISKL